MGRRLRISEYWMMPGVSDVRILLACLGAFSHFLYLGLVSQICIRSGVRLGYYLLRSLLSTGRLLSALLGISLAWPTGLENWM